MSSLQCVSEPSSDIIVYIHSAANLYYYKYTVDGVNIMCVNLLLLVPVAIGFGYGDRDSAYLAEQGKFVIALVAIIPLAYLIGMGITRYVCLGLSEAVACGIYWDGDCDVVWYGKQWNMLNLEEREIVIAVEIEVRKIMLKNERDGNERNERVLIEECIRENEREWLWDSVRGEGSKRMTRRERKEKSEILKE